MFDLFAHFRKPQVWDFNGGIHPPEMKDQTRFIPIKRFPLPADLYIPLQQHLGPQGELLVNVGDRVLKGQALTTGKGRTLPVHASTSGTIVDIGDYPSTHPSAIPERSIHLKPDGKEEWFERFPLTDYQSYKPEQLIAHIQRAGIAGLGGAVFPTASKIDVALTRVNTLIINGAECEPYITADDRLMQEYADELLIGCDILRHILNPKEILIGVEDNKPEAVECLMRALRRHENSIISVRVIPTKYPSGGAKQLTRILTGKEVPHGGRSADIGILMQNVGTVLAIKRAVIDGEPLIERIVTLTGNALNQKGNVWALLGTPVSILLHHAQYQPQPMPNVIMGGPLMGFKLANLNVPITKLSNCIIAATADEIALPEPEQACIRCGQCAVVCPASLLPQQLYWFSQGHAHEKARHYHLFDCIECGACAYVCPSHIPLVHYYRQEKAEIRDLDKQAALARNAKLRFDAKQARLAKEKQARQQRHKRAETKPDEHQQQLIQAALERVKKQRTAVTPDASGSPTIHAINSQALPDNRAVIAARQARKAQRQKTRMQQPELQVQTSAVEAQNDRKAALAAAIARAKAKKERQQVQQSNDAALPTASDQVRHVTENECSKDFARSALQTETKPSTTLSDNDARKQAVAAAIARAKARKQQSANREGLPPTEPTQSTAGEQEKRKAAVAEAIARAKARKAQQNAAQSTPSGEK